MRGAGRDPACLLEEITEEDVVAGAHDEEDRRGHDNREVPVFVIEVAEEARVGVKKQQHRGKEKHRGLGALHVHDRQHEGENERQDCGDVANSGEPRVRDGRLHSSAGVQRPVLRLRGDCRRMHFELHQEPHQHVEDCVNADHGRAELLQVLLPAARGELVAAPTANVQDKEHRQQGHEHREDVGQELVRVHRRPDDERHKNGDEGGRQAEQDDHGDRVHVQVGAAEEQAETRAGQHGDRQTHKRRAELGGAEGHKRDDDGSNKAPRRPRGRLVSLVGQPVQGQVGSKPFHVGLDEQQCKSSPEGSSEEPLELHAVLEVRPSKREAGNCPHQERKRKERALSRRVVNHCSHEPRQQCVPRHDPRDQDGGHVQQGVHARDRHVLLVRPVVVRERGRDDDEQEG
mmetsp:Transcript_30758/g.70937  ORF Transcript_30758/g.70937 Transcript_30758/m.70937 type:complete len:402 (-) Transcript_30758:1661-2866(-)